MSFATHLPNRVVRGVGAFVLADLITGLTGFSVISSGMLWFFCVSWIRIQSEYAEFGSPFGTTAQLALAWIGAIVFLPLLAAVVYLAVRAYRLPKAFLLG